MATEEAEKSLEADDSYFALPNEILSMIFVRLSFPDLTRCMRLSKRFKTMLTSNEFMKKYLKQNYNFLPVKLDAEKLKSPRYVNFDLITNCWFCFWDDSGDEPGANDPSRYIFRPLPQVWENGIITPVNFNPFAEDVNYDYHAFNKALYFLLTLSKKCDEFGLTCAPYYSSSDFPVDVCLFPWAGDELPKPKDVLEVFNVHKEIIVKSDMSGLVGVADSLPNNPSFESDDYDETINSFQNTFSNMNTNEENAKFHKWLKDLFQPSLMFCSGVNTIHPQLYFHLTILSPGWVGGVFSLAGLV